MDDKRLRSIARIDAALLAVRDKLIAHIDSRACGSVMIEVPFCDGGVRVVRFRESVDLTPWVNVG